MLAADGCASSSSDPACCFCGVWAPRRAEGVAVAMFGLSLVRACSSADVSNSAVTGLSYRDPALQDPCSRFTNGDLLGLTWHCAKSTYLILCCPDNFWVANLLEFLKNIILLGRGK